VKLRSQRILGKDTAAAIDSLDFAPADADAYRERLRGGCHLLVAQAANGTNAKRIIELLERSAAAPPAADEGSAWVDADTGVHVHIAEDGEDAQSGAAESEPAAEAEVDVQGEQASERSPADLSVEPIQEPSARTREEELLVATDEARRGGVRVRSFVHDRPAEESVLLREESIEVERRGCERELDEAELEAGGLFRERVFEIAEMREEPVVTKVAVVREELIVRKRVRERAETVRETVRHTEVAVEELSAFDV
jgi:stress response protein YsnF